MAKKEKEVEVKVVTEVVPVKAAWKNTTTGKTVRTFLQAATTILSITLPALAASEDFRAMIQQYPWATAFLAVLPVAIAGVTFLHNYFDKSVPNTTTDEKYEQGA